MFCFAYSHTKLPIWAIFVLPKGRFTQFGVNPKNKFRVVFTVPPPPPSSEHAKLVYLYAVTYFAHIATNRCRVLCVPLSL